MLHLLGINPATIRPATNILTVRAGHDVLTTITTITDPTNVQRTHVPGYGSEPASVITVNGLRHKRWTQIQSGWMVESARPLQASQIAAARDLAAKSGLVIESRNSQASLATISTVATATGGLIALGVLAAAGTCAHLAGGTLDGLRNVGGMIDIGLPCAAAHGGGLAWPGRLTWWPAYTGCTPVARPSDNHAVALADPATPRPRLGDLRRAGVHRWDSGHHGARSPRSPANDPDPK